MVVAAIYHTLVVLAAIAIVVFDSKEAKERASEGWFLTESAVGFPIITVAAGLFIVIVLGSAIINGALFNSKNNYSHMISPTTEDFTKVVEEFDADKVQTLDKVAAEALGDRVFATIGADKVSLFRVSSMYTTQVYNGKLVRVTPAEYGTLGAMFGGAGTPGYVIVDVVTGDAKFVNTKPMVYVPSGVFGKDLNRHARGSSLFCKNRNNWRFEINEDGEPYYIDTIYEYKGLFNAPIPCGIVVVNPCTGEINEYGLDDVPQWVDIVYTPNDILYEYRNYGKYQDGWWNASFVGKGVLSTTDDYAYLMKGDQLYIYTGVTSSSNDESNVGFIYANLQTQETAYIECVGAEEYSAKAAAEGAVQEKGYTAVFPTLVSVNGEPTYFLSLKDKSGLIKAYAFVDVKNYTKVKVSEAEKGVANALNAYTNMLGGTATIEDNELITKNIKIAFITGYAVNGTTIFYVEDVEGQRYMAAIDIYDGLPFLHDGDEVTVKCTDEAVSTITEIH